jgi:hypothetical protein
MAVAPKLSSASGARGGHDDRTSGSTGGVSKGVVDPKHPVSSVAAVAVHRNFPSFSFQQLPCGDMGDLHVGYGLGRDLQRGVQ